MLAGEIVKDKIEVSNDFLICIMIFDYSSKNMFLNESLETDIDQEEWDDIKQTVKLIYNSGQRLSRKDVISDLHVDGIRWSTDSDKLVNRILFAVNNVCDNTTGHTFPYLTINTVLCPKRDYANLA